MLTTLARQFPGAHATAGIPVVAVQDADAARKRRNRGVGIDATVVRGQK